MGTTCASPVAKCALGTHPALGPSPVGGPSMLPKGEHIGPYLFAAKELIPCMLLQGLMSIRALIRHPKELHTNPSQSLQSESIPAIRVYSTAAPAIRVNPSRFIITYYYIF